MSSMTFFIIFVCILGALFLIINLIFAPYNPYAEKNWAFECGFHSYLQTRLPFNISFFIYGLLFLLFDLEILLIYPYVVSSYVNGIYGLIVMLIFSIMLTLGFMFEIGKGALQISNKQLNSFSSVSGGVKKLSVGYIGSLKQIRDYSTERLTHSPL